MMMKSGFESGSRGVGTELATEMEWEMRPGGMLVQRRLALTGAPPSPMINLRISYGELKFEVIVSSRATFRELKKELEAKTGLLLAEQRVMHKGKERENGEFLDRCGVKDRSKLVVVQDPSSLERRYIEMRRNAKNQTNARAIGALSLELDKLANQVSAIEKSISSRMKVPDLQITTLIELLMRQAVKLDDISAEGDVSFQKHLQAKRVQKCVETLDSLKASNGRLKPVIVTTKWETFDPPSTTLLNYF